MNTNWSIVGPLVDKYKIDITQHTASDGRPLASACCRVSMMTDDRLVNGAPPIEKFFHDVLAEEGRDNVLLMVQSVARQIEAWISSEPDAVVFCNEHRLNRDAEVVPQANVFDDVARMMIAGDQWPCISNFNLYLDLMDEEDTELREALLAGDKKEILDALADKMWVTAGALLAAGWNGHQAWEEVRAANHAKIFPDGKMHKNADGKIIKPAGWEEPEHAQADSGLLLATGGLILADDRPHPHLKDGQND